MFSVESKAADGCSSRHAILNYNKTCLMKQIVLAAIILVLGCNPAGQHNQNSIDTIATDTVAVKFELYTDAVKTPVQLEAPAGSGERIFIADLEGKIWVFHKDSIVKQPYLDITSRLVQKDTSPEIRGMFSMAFHPRFAENHKFYVCYNAPTTIDANICKLVVSEFTGDASHPDVADAGSERRVFEVEGSTIEKNADGLAFGPDGYLYVSIGDHDDSSYENLGQNMAIYNGKMLRIDVNQTPYAIPPDNPFVGVDNVKPEIWASGLRRFWRFSFDQKSGQLIGGDVGEGIAEEINVIEKGGNYGWPVKEGDSVHYNNVALNNSPYIAPVYAYAHNEGICVIGGQFYYGDAVPLLKNKYVFADFTGSLLTLSRDGQGKWIRQTLKVVNKPADPFLICSINFDQDHELCIMGLLNTKDGFKGVVYKVVQG